MDSDDELAFAMLLEEKAAADAAAAQHSAMLNHLLHLYRLEARPRRGGSKPGRMKGKERQRASGYATLYADYFADRPLNEPKVFRRRFRMSRKLFMRLVVAVREFDPYFIAKKDAVGVLGFSSIQKCTAAMRLLAYGAPADATDDYLRISESCAIESLYRFCKAVVAVFGENYLRSPNAEDTARIMAQNAARGFPGMLGSIDCMHWEWKNCPFAWQGMYKSRKGSCSVVLEAVADHDLWIWHAFFGMAGSHNDINVLNCSSLFSKLLEGHSPPCNYTINNHDYTKGYYLADGIYPRWSTFVKTISNPVAGKNSHFATEQEAARKDVERAFGVLQARFAIVRYPALTWSKDQMWEVMTACVILHNMIIESERENPVAADPQPYYRQGPLADVDHQIPAQFYAYLQTRQEIRDAASHEQLQADLIEHLWARKGNANV
jgi:hypothetical protein